MPTISNSHSDPHRQRRVAESFGADAARYDRARNRYPEAMIAAFGDAAPGPDALDVGCGTGIAARQLQAAGWRVLGVEPDARMAAFAQQHGVAVEVASFEDWDPGERDFDAVVSATAWHWVDPAIGFAKAARLLRPGGLFGLAWTVFEQPPELTTALAAVLREMMPDVAMPTRQPGVAEYEQQLSAWAEQLARTGAFGPARLDRYAWRQDHSREQWLELLSTQGVLTRLDPARLARVLNHLGAAVDESGGRVTMDYTVVTLTANRLGAATA